MDTTDLLGSLGAGGVAFAGLTVCGMHVVPAFFIAAMVAAGLIGRLRRGGGETPG